MLFCIFSALMYGALSENPLENPESPCTAIPSVMPVQEFQSEKLKVELMIN